MKMMIYCFTYLCFCYPEPYSDVGRSYCCVFYEIFSLLYYRLFINTVGSHVMVYNAENYGNLYSADMSEFINFKK